MCWFEVGISKGSGQVRCAAGLGVLPGTCCVHYHSQPDRRRLLLESVASSGLSGYGIDDHAALLWTDTRRRRLFGPSRRDRLPGRAGRRPRGRDPPRADRGRPTDARRRRSP
jgi:hypothetical protein